MKNKYKLLLFITVLLILTASTYASFQPSISLSNPMNPNGSNSVSQNDSESLHRGNLVSNKTKTCLTCNDTGTLTKTTENYLTCPACAGAGKTTCPYCNGSGGLRLSGHLGTDICQRCLGTGRQICPDCGGKGYKSETVTIKEKCPICKDKIPP